MAKKTMQKIKDMSVEQINAALNEKRDQIQKLTFGIAGSKNKNVRLLRTTRREIAQILTELHSRNK